MSGARFSLKKIGLNAISIGGGEVANKASTFLVYAAVSRIAGLEAFGQLALGLTLLYTCHVFGYAGLPTVLIRLAARRPHIAKRYLVHGYIATAMTSCLAALAMVAIALAMRYLIALGNLPGNAAMVLGSLIVLWQGYGVLGVTLVIVFSRFLTLLSLHGLVRLAVAEDSRRSRVRWSLVLCLLSRARIFLGSDGIAAIGASLFGLLLSKFTSEREVGMLNAAFQLLQPIQIMYRSVGHSAFPPLVAAAKTSKQAVANLVHSILSLLIRLAFPASLVMFVFAGDFLDLVYGSKGFRQGAYVLQIVAFNLLFDPLNPVFGHGLWAVGADRAVFRIVLTNIIFNLMLGLILIGSFGLAGAAACTLVSSIVNTGQHYAMFTKRVASPRLMTEILRLTPAIALALAVVILSPWSRFANLPIAVLLYSAVVLAMTPAAVGLLNPLYRKSHS
jgi:O-antigen/teichoic acid export membrane protein